MYEKLCGTGKVNVHMLITMKDLVEPGVAAEREHALATRNWRSMIKEGSTILRYDYSSAQSASKVIDFVLGTLD
jgi:hypothetical protein